MRLDEPQPLRIIIEEDGNVDRYWQAAARIVEAQAGMRVMSDDEIVHLIRKIAVALHQVYVTPAEDLVGLLGEPLGSGPSVKSKALTKDDAIQPGHITCLVCGQEMRLISKKHLAYHGLTPEEYKEKFGYPPTTPLLCGELQGRRSDQMKEGRIWEKVRPAESHSETTAQPISKPQLKPVMDPADAINEDRIVCLICGKEQQSLTQAHFRKHKITSEEYREAFGYEDDRPLMSGRQLKKMKVISHSSLAKAKTTKKAKAKPKSDAAE